jgi:hypothetical protein
LVILNELLIFQSEISRRTIIDTYLLEGASLCGQKFLTVFTQCPLKATLENNTTCIGSLDYLTSLPDVKPPSMDDYLEDRLLGRLTPGRPFFTVVQAKKGEPFGVGQTQLLGEMKALAIQYSGYVLHHIILISISLQSSNIVPYNISIYIDLSTEC